VTHVLGRGRFPGSEKFEKKREGEQSGMRSEE